MLYGSLSAWKSKASALTTAAVVDGALEETVDNYLHRTGVGLYALATRTGPGS